MTVAKDKAIVSGIVGALGAVAAVISGYASLFILTGFSTFFFTMLIQYGSVKFKIATTLASVLGFSYLYLFGGGGT